MKIAKSVLDLVGSTPLVELNNFSKILGISPIVAKVEKFNPAGSVKDRVGVNMIVQAQKQGLLKEGSLIVEPTSGNTGVGLAMVCAVLGFNLTLTMPSSMSVERRKLLSAYGANLVLTDPAKGMAGAIEQAKLILEQNPGAFCPMQFENPANPDAHNQTALEIYQDTEGKIDAFVACVGTGGTISGVGRALKKNNNGIYVVAVEPQESQVLQGNPSSPHGIEGIGANFVPKNFDRTVVDEILTASTQQSRQMCRLLAKSEGLLCGISSGAALHCGVELAKREEFRDKRIVVLLPDTGERYLSTALFQD